MPAFIVGFARRLCAALRGLVAGAVIVFYAYMALAVLLQVLSRYVFNYSIDWATETATFAQIWMVLLAAGIAMRRQLHVGVDVLVRQLPPWLNRIVIVITALLCLWFLWVAITGSFKLIRIGFIQTSPALGIPMWLPYLSLPVGLSYFAFEFLLALVQRWQTPSAAQPAAAADLP